MKESITIEELISQNLALKALVIALYSLHDDRQLINSIAQDIFSKFPHQGSLEENNQQSSLEQLLAELQSFGFRK